MKLSLRVAPAARLMLSTDVQQGLHLLTLPRLALRTEVQTLVNANPFLRFVEESPRELDDWGFAPIKGDSDWIDWESFSPHYDQVDLEGSLLQQLSDLGIADGKYFAARAWIESLDSHGRLTCDAAEIARRANCARSVAESALSLVRTFEPSGLFASDIYECWRLQLAARPDTQHFIDVHMRDIMQLGVVGYCKQFRLAQTAVRSHLNIIKSLCRTFSLAEKDAVLQAEAEIIRNPPASERSERSIHTPSGWLDFNWLGDFNIETVHRSERHLWEFGVAKWTEARMTVQQLKQRRDTVLRAIVAICGEQHEYLFSLDVEDLKPMNHSAIADIVGLHQTTIGRTISNKSILVDIHEISLGGLFSSRIDANSSTKAVQVKLAALLARFPTLSDVQAAIAMRSEFGIVIARRTITKYRAELSIRTRNKR